jgi:hypothetical protein
MDHKKRFESKGYVFIHTDERDENGELIYKQEHRIVAEDMLGRRLKEGEVVHHMDEVRNNNYPDNLLVLSAPMHNKLHEWMKKHTITPNDYQAARLEQGCTRCENCEYPVNPGYRFCSHNCEKFSLRRVERPSKEELAQLLWEKPTTKIAEDYGVSDVAVSKWAKTYEIEKPPRGYWAKQKAHEALKDL